jgi:hypothetical protein
MIESDSYGDIYFQFIYLYLEVAPDDRYVFRNEVSI